MFGVNRHDLRNIHVSNFLVQVMCRYLLSMQSGSHGKPLVKLPKAISKEAQMLSAQLIRDGHVKHKEILSLDILNNSLHSLYHLGAVHKEKRYVSADVDIQTAHNKVVIDSLFLLNSPQ